MHRRDFIVVFPQGWIGQERRRETCRVGQPTTASNRCNERNRRKGRKLPRFVGVRGWITGRQHPIAVVQRTRQTFSALRSWSTHSRDVDPNERPDAECYARDRFGVISGCSSGGKSALLTELGQRGYATIEEPCWRIVTEELLGDSSILSFVIGQQAPHLALVVDPRTTDGDTGVEVIALATTSAC
jgi:hypothetical protein